MQDRSLRARGRSINKKGVNMRRKIFCRAYARSTGKPCLASAMRNGRCRNHGGLSTGPKSPEGRRSIAEATRQRMLSGQRMRALEGYRAWLDNGGRERLSKLAISRFRRQRLLLTLSSSSRWWTFCRRPSSAEKLCNRTVNSYEYPQPYRAHARLGVFTLLSTNTLDPSKN